MTNPGSGFFLLCMSNTRSQFPNDSLPIAWAVICLIHFIRLGATQSLHDHTCHILARWHGLLSPCGVHGDPVGLGGSSLVCLLTLPLCVETRRRDPAALSIPSRSFHTGWLAGSSSLRYPWRALEVFGFEHTQAVLSTVKGNPGFLKKFLIDPMP